MSFHPQALIYKGHGGIRNYSQKCSYGDPIFVTRKYLFAVLYTTGSVSAPCAVAHVSRLQLPLELIAAYTI